MTWAAHRKGRPQGRPLQLPISFVILVLLITSLAGAQQYAVKGMVVSVNRPGGTFTASIDEIPGFMRAMTMPFEVRQAKDLDGLAPGAMVEFTLVVDAKTSYAERITNRQIPEHRAGSVRRQPSVAAERHGRWHARHTACDWRRWFRRFR